MTTGNQNPKESLSLADSYSAAVQLYNQELKTLGERTMAFLIIQSILVAAFVTILVNPNWFPYVFLLVVLGISIVGILFCLFHHIAGRAGSKAAFRWRQYMFFVEGNQQDTPLNKVSNYCEEKHKKHGEAPKKRKVCAWLSNLLTRLQCDRCLLERAPLPTVWVITPSIFVLIWLGASLYATRRLFIEGDPLRSNPFLPLPLSILISIIVTLFALGILCYLILNLKAWWLDREDIS